MKNSTPSRYKCLCGTNFVNVETVEKNDICNSSFTLNNNTPKPISPWVKDQGFGEIENRVCVTVLKFTKNAFYDDFCLIFVCQ